MEKRPESATDILVISFCVLKLQIELSHLLFLTKQTWSESFIWRKKHFKLEWTLWVKNNLKTEIDILSFLFLFERAKQ